MKLSERKKLVWNFTFGVEDSLVSTVGLVSGIAAGGLKADAILMTGLVLVCVEAFSMGVGSFLSDQSAEESEKHKEIPSGKSLPGAMVMFVSYLLSGMIPLVPYTVFAVGEAVIISIGLTIVSLFVLGVYNGWRASVHPAKEGLKMVVFGALAIFAGIAVGRLFRLG
jgi:VIT1/CCC1 family predicted Fe2+/Mn2+ transporter